MILCLCEGVSDRAIDDAIRAGARSVRQVTRATGAGTGCGSCACDVRSRLKATRQAEPVRCTAGRGNVAG
ncbi:MAG: (2Fe-2S)-binding protein [Alphaproteobacteria bacterium]|nr:(2Fe-2S)-binding protein [Alphaproteobacteria bacterium]